MIFRVCLGRIQKVTWNLEYLVDVTCRGTCRKCDFKLYKMQTKSENHETCRGVVLSHVEAVVKKLWRFRANCDVGCQKPRHLHMWWPIETCCGLHTYVNTNVFLKSSFGSLCVTSWHSETTKIRTTHIGVYAATSYNSHKYRAKTLQWGISNPSFFSTGSSIYKY